VITANTGMKYMYEKFSVIWDVMSRGVLEVQCYLGCNVAWCVRSSVLSGM